MRFHLLVLCLAFASAPCMSTEEEVQDEAQDGEGDSPKDVGPKDEEKTDEITEEKHVMVLHVNNFARALSENKYLLVEFYAPWCGHCNALEPEYANAAGILKNETTGIRLAKVNAIEEGELAEEFEIESFPTLKFFKDGARKNATNFTGKRDAEGIVQWLRRRAGPSATPLETEQSAQEFIDTHNVVAIGFFTDVNNEDVKTFYEIAVDVTDVTFGIATNPEIFKKYGVENTAVVLFKKFDERRVDFKVLSGKKMDKDALSDFIKNNSLELVIEFSEKNSEKIFSSKIHNHLILFINSTVELHIQILESYRVVAAEFKGKILFILIDVTAGFSHVLKYFGLTDSDTPTLRLINTDTVKKFAMGGTNFTTDSIRLFCHNVLEGKLKPHMMSEELPEAWDEKPVKVLVGKNFEEVAFDETKNVFIEFYAPWCGHCKELEPVWEELGEKYKDHENIIIAKMDSTANEVESVNVPGFPTIKYFPAGSERKIIDYNGNRNVETFSEFLDNGGELPKKPEEEEDEDKVFEESRTEAPKQNNETKDEL